MRLRYKGISFGLFTRTFSRYYCFVLFHRLKQSKKVWGITVGLPFVCLGLWNLRKQRTKL